MSSFAKTLVATTVSAVLTCGLCAPAANASTVEVRGNVCTFHVTDREVKTINAYDSTVTVKDGATLTREQAQTWMEKYRELETEFSESVNKAKAAYQAGALTKAEYDELMADAQKVHDYALVSSPAVEACATNGDGTYSQSQAELSTVDGHLTEAGIGVVATASVLAVIGIIVAALPAIKPMLPPQIQAMLP